MKFIEHPVPGCFDTTVEYYQTDSEELFSENVSRFDSQWIYAHMPIQYKFNNVGFRMEKNPSEINSHNYMMFFGCSYTLAIGVPLEYSYAYIVSQTLGIDYINCGVGGASPRYIFDGVMMHLDSAVHYPKIIVINWTHLFRNYYYSNRPLFKAPEAADGQQFAGSYRDFLLNEENTRYKFELMRSAVQTITANLGIKLVEFTMTSDYENLEFVGGNKIVPLDSDISIVNRLLGRDIVVKKDPDGRRYYLAHPGVENHGVAARWIESQI